VRQRLFIVVVLVVLMGASGCIGGSSARPSGACQAASAGWQARMICKSAVRYSEAKLGVSGVQVSRFRIGGGAGDCAIAEVDTPLGSRRVLFSASGKAGEDIWQPFAVSKSFRWSDYVADSDVDCGLYNAGLLSKRDRPKTGYATS
jgi:hypothetical protein